MHDSSARRRQSAPRSRPAEAGRLALSEEATMFWFAFFVLISVLLSGLVSFA
jgi:hypothetical protein